MFTGCGGAYRTHSRMHRHKVLKSSCNRNADISCAYRRAYADRDGFPPDSTLVVFFQSVAANDRTRSTLQQTRFSTRSSPPSTAFVEFQYLRAHAHVHTRLRCRCSFESFRDNSSRQINLFSPRSNLFQPYVKHVFTLVSRVDRCRALEIELSRRQRIYFSIGITRLRPDYFLSSFLLLWFPRSRVSPSLLRKLLASIILA